MGACLSCDDSDNNGDYSGGDTGNSGGWGGGGDTSYSGGGGGGGYSGGGGGGYDATAQNYALESEAIQMEGQAADEASAGAVLT
jgi:hypothetical protein